MDTQLYEDTSYTIEESLSEFSEAFTLLNKYTFMSLREIEDFSSIEEELSKGNERFAELLFKGINPSMMDYLEKKGQAMEKGYEELFGYFSGFGMSERIPERENLKRQGYNFDSVDSFGEFQKQVHKSAETIEENYLKLKEDIIPRVFGVLGQYNDLPARVK